ncbi:MAG: elongation factor P [Planctomycetota bacterium]|nr:MAG: elongation factor P [Planctomycetota bacterium]
MIKATQVRPGHVIRVDGELYLVTETTHVTPGKGEACIQTKLKRLKDGTTVPRRFDPTERIDNVFVEKREMEFLYEDGRVGVFMDSKTYDQIEIPLDQIEQQLKYMVPNCSVSVSFCDGKPVSVELPTAVVLEVAEAAPYARGNTVTNVMKDAKLETGIVIKVPHYIEAGEKVKVDTRTGEFIERVK